MISTILLKCLVLVGIANNYVVAFGGITQNRNLPPSTVIPVGSTAEQEWDIISGQDSRPVFNMGLGSLFSYAGRQYTKNATFAEPQTPLIFGFAQNIKREFTYPFRYMAVGARLCRPDEVCPPTNGAYFEVATKEDYLKLRSREDDYDLLEVTPAFDDGGDDLPADAYYFVWGSREQGLPDSFVSQSYWDMMIGGLLADDGQLLDTRRYTWDIVSEISMGGEKMASVVAKSPTRSLDARLQSAVDLVETTYNPRNIVWRDDRLCPFTGNANIIQVDKLAYSPVVTDAIKAPAMGSVTPAASNAFYDIVDSLLVKGGVDLSERQPMDCQSTAADAINRSRWTENMYYDDLVAWQEANSVLAN